MKSNWKVLLVVASLALCSGLFACGKKDTSTPMSSSPPTDRGATAQKTSAAKYIIRQSKKTAFAKKQLESIDVVLEKLREGEIYTSVPQEMKVAVESIIEAGIAPKVTKKIREEIQSRGGKNIKITGGVIFDPRGTEMKLDVPKDEFQVSDVEQGMQTITQDFPGKWTWRVKPLSSGKKLIIIKAIFKLKDLKNNIINNKTIEIFREERVVLVNPAHSAIQFFVNNWKDVLILIFGSGSFVGGIRWIIDNNKKKDEKQKEEEKSEDNVLNL
jgi:hypothetical protein